jgi:hypothetical protein
MAGLNGNRRGGKEKARKGVPARSFGGIQNYS